MRTTLEIEDDVLQAAKELAEREHSTTGRMLSALARRGLASPSSEKSRASIRNGVPVLPSRDEIITLEKIQRIRNQEGV